MQIIYDIGANDGSDLPYYIKKAKKVVAVEANPLLSQQISNRRSSDIRAGHLVVENKVLTADEQGEVNFYLHKVNSDLSQFGEPAHPSEFEKVVLPSLSVARLFQIHGEPHYVKIDAEHYDVHILRALFEAGIHPPYISAESHSWDVLALLSAIGGYSAFKLVDGPTINKRFGNHRIETLEGSELYSFKYGSAGPFGQDIPGPWLTGEQIMRLLAVEGMGWKDIHATSCQSSDGANISDWSLAFRMIRKQARRIKRSVASRR